MWPLITLWKNFYDTQSYLQMPITYLASPRTISEIFQKSYCNLGVSRCIWPLRGHDSMLLSNEVGESEFRALNGQLFVSKRTAIMPRRELWHHIIVLFHCICWGYSTLNIYKDLRLDSLLKHLCIMMWIWCGDTITTKEIFLSNFSLWTLLGLPSSGEIYQHRQNDEYSSNTHFIYKMAFHLLYHIANYTIWHFQCFLQYHKGGTEFFRVCCAQNLGLQRKFNLLVLTATSCFEIYNKISEPNDSSGIRSIWSTSSTSISFWNMFCA